MKSVLFVATALAFSSHAVADWQSKSRSDLAPPRLNITIPATRDVGKGYLFVAPFAGFPDTPTEQHGPRQAGPYIFRDDGELVWSGYGIHSIWSTNFQASRWKGKDILFSFEGDHNPGYGHGHGHITILDNHYETIRELRAGNHKLVDKHEFHIVNEETGLIQIYQPVVRDLTAWGASAQQQWIVNAIIQELDIATGKLLFDVDKNSDGNYLISARDACSIHKINGADGSIIWKLNGKDSSFRVPKDAEFCFQHHARFLSQEDDGEIISLYDNSAHGTEHSGGSEVHTAPISSGKIVQVNTTSWEAKLLQAFFPPDDLLSKSQGSTQILPNGNALVNWGSSGAVTEYLPDGTPIFHANLPRQSSTPTWTLATSVLVWRITTHFAITGQDFLTKNLPLWPSGATKGPLLTVIDDYGSEEFLGEVERSGFETSIRIPGENVNAISAKAIDTRGRPLRETGVAFVEQEIKPGSSSGMSSFAQTSSEKVNRKSNRP
ncbi:ASST-domain-containing protein [Hypoxylon sp. NC1633]|nr:ASST-domain-containing protein [Hypoxylon sp. NC1633]